MLLQLDGHVLFSENGSLTLLLTSEFTKRRHGSLGKADMELRLYFQGTFRLTNR